MVTFKNIKDAIYLKDSIIIDLHGCHKDEAEEYLDNMITYMLPEIHEIVIIHGYRSGQVLKNMIDKELNNERIKLKLPCNNLGRTKIIIE